MKKLPNCSRHVMPLLIFLFCFSETALSQLRANFTADNVSGCSPIVVKFSDQSTGNPGQWRWDLGNGVVSFLQNPSATYFNPGTYNIKLVVRDASGSDSLVRSQFITVYANPVPDFKPSDTTGCFPLHVQFSDLSVAGSGQLASWSWDFGDGSVSTASNPSHVYLSSGNFSVTLKVTNSVGCTKTISRSNYIKIAQGVKANFTSSGTVQCAAPATINFTNTSTGPGTIFYNWDFGDGSNSNVANAFHTYAVPGTYTVSLVATSLQGCTDTVIKKNIVSVGNIHSQFIFPDTVCASSGFMITNTTTPAPSSVAWDFGNGTTSSQVNPIKSYAAAGTYVIRLVNNFGSCVDSVKRTVIVSKRPVAAFFANVTASCKAPFVVSFLAQTAGATKWQWLFGDGTSSSFENPIHTFTTEGDFTVSLVVTNAGGCSDTITKKNYIQVRRPSISIQGLPQTGCVPVTASLAATITTNQPVISYLWKFGDGTTSSATSPVHTYTTAGTYSVTLVISTSGGCTDSLVMVNAVHAGNKPHAAFEATPSQVCNVNPVGFVDKSTGDVDQWLWDFGDVHSSIQQNPVHVFGGLGKFPVTLIVWSNTCADTVTVNDAVNVLPPISGFNVDRSCTDKYTIGFRDGSVGATTVKWDFGDGTSSTLRNPVHIYPSPGVYKCVYTVFNETCWNINWEYITIVDEKPELIANRQTLCKGSPVVFSAAPVIDSNIATWQWDFGDGTSSSQVHTTSHVYRKAGMFTASLTTTDINGCSETKSIGITVSGPKAAFASNAQSACIGNSSVSFTATSSSDGAHPIIKTIWNYGDGVVDSTGVSPSLHLYNTAGTYRPSLVVIDNSGCSDSTTLPAPIIIAQPRADFYSPDSNSCTARPVSFINNSTGEGLEYNWLFGDGLDGLTTSPVHQYSNTGSYSVALLVTDKYGCKDSIIRDNYITISLPHVSFALSDSFSTCPPLLVNFTNSSANYTGSNWDFGDGSVSSLNNPSHYYVEPGIFYAKLVITGPGGCTEGMTKRIEVRGPRGTFTYTPLVACNPSTVNFKATTLNRISFIWDFSDGTILSTTDSIVTHVYTSPGDYNPKMILLDGSGCNFPVVGPDAIKVVGIDASFQTDKNKLCNAGTVNFQNNTVSNDLITDYSWNFGDAETSNSQQASHQYKKPGIYDVQLTVTTQTGCVSTVSDVVQVFTGPLISIAGDSGACVPATLNFLGKINRGNADSLHWNWDFGNGQGDSMQNPQAAVYAVANGYRVIAVATDDRGCKDSASKSIDIHPLPPVNAGNDQLLCNGNSLQLNATGATTYSWSPSVGLNCTSCAAPITSAQDTTTYIVTGASEYGCLKADTVTINVKKKFVLHVSPDDSLCAGEFTYLMATGADEYTWTPSVGLDKPGNASTKAAPGVTTLYKVLARDRDNCFADTANVLITVTPLPSVEAGADLTVVAGSTGQLHAKGSPDVTGWKWTPQFQLSCFDCAEPRVIPKQTVDYTITASNAAGCTSKDNVSVFVTCSNGNLFIPNTFSPNADGMNDRFYPRGAGIGTIRSFRVFNRWGELVFERTSFNANDAGSGWDGTYKGQKLPPDVFVYTCEVVCDNNQVLLFRGDVTLIQ